jgi:phosphatidylserine/phosphatidylglycerophosphate/cardiolipin synthase-like enzyme
MHEDKYKDSSVKDFGPHDFEIVSSTDHPYAIADSLKINLRETKESLDISAPWNSKSFVDMIRTFVSKPRMVKKRLLTRTPTEKDIRTFKTVASFANLKNSKVMCKPYLHSKFIIVDNRIVLWDSVNPTSSGLYDNDEILYISKDPFLVTRHQEIFDDLWHDRGNSSWENVQQHFGFKDYARAPRKLELK